MLPNRMHLKKQTEEQLKRLKSHTGVTPNVSARIAFFRSLESGYRFSGEPISLDGGLSLDKVTWLGDLELAVETLLRKYYPELGSKELEQAWAAHVEDGIASLRSHKSLTGFSNTF
ncbi:DNA sulfur modification protein DndE [Neptunomonas qingdaonensis]|uniref:DNA sulfur modification protein DndE n=1 Tax=Neptunomonas qingdaonensis TaxID=1045558 RepID=A0A1I2TUW0_9GAMM|nr:DNA sulfur modification protein DndE [Neptunomonas qingdaonensis]SFG68682.1 DNA sulfur modification protein DndE [Neptunomonas qingdaonensis]